MKNNNKQNESYAVTFYLDKETDDMIETLTKKGIKFPSKSHVIKIAVRLLQEKEDRDDVQQLSDK